jgi:AmmeMemoRadiSam system protein A
MTPAPLFAEQKRLLLHAARSAVEDYVLNGRISEFETADSRLLMKEEGAFVTLHKRGALRGCVGNIIGQGPLIQTVRDMAVAAATGDPRFTPLVPAELNEIDIGISVLSRPAVETEPSRIIPGVHGVIVSRGGRRGVFLPQVAAETGWTREELLAHLCSEKAGLPADSWKDPGTRLEVFTAQVFGEREGLAD